MKLIPPDGTVQSLKKVFFLNYFVGKVGRGLEDSETLFALIYISKDDVEIDNIMILNILYIFFQS